MSVNPCLKHSYYNIFCVFFNLFHVKGQTEYSSDLVNYSLSLKQGRKVRTFCENKIKLSRRALSLNAEP